MLRASRAAGLHVYVEGGERRGRGGGKKNKGGEGGNRVARHLKVKTSKYIQCTERGKGKKKRKGVAREGGGGKRRRGRDDVGRDRYVWRVEVGSEF